MGVSGHGIKCKFDIRLSEEDKYGDSVIYWHVEYRKIEYIYI